jgi:hypothetical protein
MPTIGSVVERDFHSIPNGFASIQFGETSGASTTAVTGIVAETAAPVLIWIVALKCVCEGRGGALKNKPTPTV